MIAWLCDSSADVSAPDTESEQSPREAILDALAWACLWLSIILLVVMPE